MDGKGSFPLSDDDEEALQFGVARQIPALPRGRQASDFFVGQQEADIDHRSAPKQKRFFKRFWKIGEFDGSTLTL
ncbi:MULTISPECIES: hypothetical protein [unclassified Bradyrhizobium]|uniref:hypothetical protein n=1 Tax=unclassified Bradyrhizobium TaxID=2631580 RepID=UPI002916D339|nr:MULTISPECIES: hypothetical protein [unclassified Bradyrhizobium]